MRRLVQTSTLTSHLGSSHSLFLGQQYSPIVLYLSLFETCPERCVRLFLLITLRYKAGTNFPFDMPSIMLIKISNVPSRLKMMSDDVKCWRNYLWLMLPFASAAEYMCQKGSGSSLSCWKRSNISVTSLSRVLKFLSALVSVILKPNPVEADDFPLSSLNAYPSEGEFMRANYLKYNGKTLI